VSITSALADDEEATTVGALPPDLMAEGEADTSEWPELFETFKKVKKQCGESTDGLTFEKFKLTLHKHRDALMAKHACKRVRFSVNVKDGKASLKASPVRD
jgi:hypothetical protein